MNFTIFSLVMKPSTHSIMTILLLLMISQSSVIAIDDHMFKLHEISHNDSKVVHQNHTFGLKSYLPIPGMNMCSLEFGDEGDHQCHAVHIKLPKFSAEALEAVLGPEDNNTLVRRAYIDVRQHIHDPTSTTTSIAVALDAFLTPRPWWIVMREVSTHSGGLEPHEVKAGHTIFHIFLLRHSQLVEPHIRLIAGVQYPPPDVCGLTILQIGHMVNSGWGSHLSMYGGSKGDNPWRIFDIYDSNTNLAKEDVAYSSGSTCPTTVNKRRCAFLPLTNCSLPTFLTKADSDYFQSNRNIFWNGDFAFYTNATETGELIKGNPGSHNEPQNDYQKELYNLYWRKTNDGQDHTFKPSRFVDGRVKELNSERQGDGYDRPYIRYQLPPYGWMMRPTALYRSMIDTRIEVFRHNQSFAADTECVALHIRRGDRTLPGVNITDYCLDHQRRFNPDRCENRTGHTVNCEGSGDLGCWTAHAFGELRLADYLERAWHLLETRNIFVMTDDGEWLEREKTVVDKQWNIVALAGIRFSESRQTDNGIDFLAAVQVARQCKAMVGHWGSAISFHLYYSMCVQHSNLVGVCPPACNIGGFNRF